MAIKFICSCGKHLKARDEMAARRSVCPACGKPVGVPSRQQAQAAAGPMSPLDRFRTRRCVPIVETATPNVAPPTDEFLDEVLAETRTAVPVSTGKPPVDTTQVRMVLPPKHRRHERRPWQLETRWYQCLLHPFRAWPLVLALSAAMAGLSGLTTYLVPEALMLQETPGPFWSLCAMSAMLAVPILVYACGFLDCVLTSAAVGEVQAILWPGKHVKLALRSCLTWLVCFAAGPIVPAAVALYFWIRSGDFEIVDWIILGQLSVVAVSYWLLALGAVCQRHRLRDANPVRVAELVERMGLKIVVAILVASLLALGHVVIIGTALDRIHATPGRGVPMLVAGWLGVMFFGTFFLRLLGVWLFALPALPTWDTAADAPSVEPAT